MSGSVRILVASRLKTGQILPLVANLPVPVLTGHDRGVNGGGLTNAKRRGGGVMKGHGDMPVNENDLETQYTAQEAAAFLMVSDRTLRRLIADGDLEAVYIGSGRGRPRITRRALLDYANRRSTRNKPKDGAPGGHP